MCGFSCPRVRKVWHKKGAKMKFIIWMDTTWGIWSMHDEQIVFTAEVFNEGVLVENIHIMVVV